MDLWLVGATLILGILGVVWVASAAARESVGASFFHRAYVRQAIWLLIGLGVAGGVIWVDYNRICRWSLLLYWGSVLLLLIVLIPGIGQVRLGARRWIDLGPIQFQPSEPAKIAVILALANFLSRPESELRSSKMFLKALGMVLLPVGLILKEPDLGSSLVFFPVALVMMYVGGVPVRYLKRVLGVGVLLALVVVANVFWIPYQWRFVPLEPYQERRLWVYFGTPRIPPNATAEERRRLLQVYRDASYNVEQALISVGSGGLWGKGWQKGSQNALGYLPRAVAHNDFIFSVIAEESGFVGSVLILLLYGLILWRGLMIANQARDRLGKLLAVGITTLLFTHVFINIGMNIRLMPVTGLPLPLLSYGGTSVVSCLLGIGLIENVYFHRKE